MTTRPNILVTSAAGKTGLQTSLQLLQKGYPVRAFVHRADHRAEMLKQAGAEVFLGDQYAVADMRQAMKGVQRAYHCAPTAPNALHFSAVFTVAALENRLEHIVTLGQWLSSPSHPSLFTREVWLGEEILDSLPGMTQTIVNVGWFADNYFMVLEPTAQLGLFTMPLGDGDQLTNAPPSNEDIAAVSVGALIDPASHAGKTYRPTGPELLSPNRIAETFGKVLGRKVRYQNISEAMFLKAMSALRPPNFSEAVLTQLRLYAEEYRRGTFAVGAPTTAVQDVAGRQPEDFESIARRVVAKRPEAVRSLSNRARAVSNFLKILMTAKPDPDRIEADRGHVRLAQPQFSQDSQDWIASHDGQRRSDGSSFVADAGLASKHSAAAA